MTLLLRGFGVFGTFEKQKQLLLGVRMLNSLLQARGCGLTCWTAVALDGSLGLCLDHRLALGSLGNGAFLGALAMPGLLDVEVLVDRVDFTGMADEALGAETGT